MVGNDDWEGPEPTDEQVLSSEIEEVDGEDFHEGLIYHILKAEVTREDPVYRGSIKRLALHTGLPAEDVQIIIGRLITLDMLEPVAPFGYRVRIM